MAKGKTIWEMLTGWWSGPLEQKFYNPLRARVGSAILINTVELRDLNFFIKAIHEYKRSLEGKDFLFADYVILARPLHGDDIWMRLRLNPVDDPDRVAGLSHDVLLLQRYDEMAYNKELHDVVNDTTRVFQVHEEGKPDEEYRRIHDLTGGYKAQVTILEDADKDGTVESDEVKKTNLEYWDYWREIQDEAGQPVTQFLFVEMDTDTGWFQLWRGETMDPQRVMVM